MPPGASSNKQKPQVPVCWNDDEPLIETMEFRGAEYYCVICNKKYGFLSTKMAESTPLLLIRRDALKVLYNLERAERKKLLGS